MDIDKALQDCAGLRLPALKEKDHHALIDYFTGVIQKQKTGEISVEAAVESMMFISQAIDNGDIATVRNTINQDNWPSKTGNPSGGARTNAKARTL
ncbi:TPA: hypothetical protein SK284_004349 [Yersinia enterocolitica]|nr:hypothetical protein [Yersinia enterocolitica]HEI6934386.1 hypothetical protein [Yersinia enterocolitica]HEI6937962.1 hypothetical protein [Yersinia enterocolitica]